MLDLAFKAIDAAARNGEPQPKIGFVLKPPSDRVKPLIAGLLPHAVIRDENN